MPNEWSRRRLFAVAATVTIAGCVDADGSSESDDGTQTNSSAGATADDEVTDGNDVDADETDATEESTVHEDYETTAVRVETADGDEIGAVTAAIADTDELRYLGLSDTDDLPADRGMLFVYESVEERTFVMREMDFGIDIVYADADGTITEIHHAPAPEPDEDGAEHRYPGRGQYVLEVVYEWTTDRGVREGDVLAFDRDT